MIILLLLILILIILFSKNNKEYFENYLNNLKLNLNKGINKIDYFINKFNKSQFQQKETFNEVINHLHNTKNLIKNNIFQNIDKLLQNNNENLLKLNKSFPILIQHCNYGLILCSKAFFNLNKEQYEGFLVGTLMDQLWESDLGEFLMLPYTIFKYFLSLFLPKSNQDSEPTSEPILEPTSEPILEPTSEPTVEPISKPTEPTLELTPGSTQHVGPIYKLGSFKKCDEGYEDIKTNEECAEIFSTNKFKGAYQGSGSFNEGVPSGCSSYNKDEYAARFNTYANPIIGGSDGEMIKVCKIKQHQN